MTNDNSYSFVEKFLHCLALDFKFTREFAFDLECELFLKKNKSIIEKYYDERSIHVCGLARSGTTLLLNLLHDTGKFYSLSYRDMPFVMSPNLWKLLSNNFRVKGELKERAHGDGMLINYDSVEAFEEIFWSTFCKVNKNNKFSYEIENPSKEILDNFSSFKKNLFLSNFSSSRLRYLSKNNNNCIRISEILSDSSSVVLLVYRNPLETAKSLLRMHENFSSRNLSKFDNKYFEWLGHHEFGINQKPFLFNGEQFQSKYEKKDIRYWCEYWYFFYKNAIENILDKNNLYLFNYDNLCRNPKKQLMKLSNVIDCNLEDNGSSIKMNSSILKSCGFDEIDKFYEYLSGHEKNI